jgi:hypothetical protein
MYVKIYDIVIPNVKSSLLLITNFSGLLCSRVPINLKHALITFRTENIKQNKNKVSKLSIFFSFFQNFVSKCLQQSF